MSPSLRRAAVLLTAVTLVACAPRNPKLVKVDETAGYRFRNLAAGEGNSNRTFVVLTFSGGGTRAAAFAYGVLEKLRDEKIDGGRSLLDEVDVISSVSGGSFAAAYYGLFGRDEFFRRFPQQVLHRKIETALILRVLAPWNWPRLLSPRFGRADLADEYYDRAIFDRRTFETMPRRRPFIILNATDMTLGARFPFTQDQFDRLCSDLSGVSVSRGVTASSAFPVAFTPLTFRNYPKDDCAGYATPEWVENALASDLELSPARYDHAKTWKSYEDPRRRYVHLLDGGLADNIGLRGPEFAMRSFDSPWTLIPAFNALVEEEPVVEPIERLVVIVVDAKPDTSVGQDGRARPPWVGAVLNASATNPMENYSSDTVELLRDDFREWDNAAADYDAMVERCGQLADDLCEEARAAADCREEKLEICRGAMQVTEDDRPPHPALYRIHVRFEAAREAIRSRLGAVPTRLQLCAKDVDLLVEAAKQILEDSQEYRCLRRAMGGTGLPPDDPSECPEG